MLAVRCVAAGTACGMSWTPDAVCLVMCAEQSSKPVVFMNTTTSYSYDSDLMPGCKVTDQGLACPTASHMVKVIPSNAATAVAAAPMGYAMAPATAVQYVQQ